MHCLLTPIENKCKYQQGKGESFHLRKLTRGFRAQKPGRGRGLFLFAHDEPTKENHPIGIRQIRVRNLGLVGIVGMHLIRQLQGVDENFSGIDL